MRTEDFIIQHLFAFKIK